MRRAGVEARKVGLQVSGVKDTMVMVDNANMKVKPTLSDSKATKEAIMKVSVMHFLTGCIGIDLPLFVCVCTVKRL